MLLSKTLEIKLSKYNGEIKVKWMFGMGRSLEIGGLTQSGKVLEWIWGSVIKRIKKQDAKIKNCLVLGTAGGSIFKIIKTHYPKAKITGVDIDPVIVSLGKKYFPDNFRDVEVIISDAWRIVHSASHYDLVVVDLYNGKEFPIKFEKKLFFDNIKQRLKKNGICIINRLKLKEQNFDEIEFKVKLEKVFRKVEIFHPEVNTMFICS